MHTLIQGRLGAQTPPPVKSHSYTPKMQTIFTLMLSRATKAIELSFARERERERACARDTFSQNFDFYVVQTA